MCGRFVLTTAGEALAEHFDLETAPALAPRYNIAPSQEVAVVRRRQVEGSRELAMLRWGLVPHWARDPKMGARMINARSETVAEKPSFRDAFKRGRCLVPVSGFYEWQRSGKGKQPYYFRGKDERPLAIAALWDRWRGPENTVIESCALLTTAANELMRPIHDRMPVIVEPANYRLWLDPASRNADRLHALLTPRTTDELEAFAVGTAVNNPRHDDATNVKPIAV